MVFLTAEVTITKKQSDPVHSKLTVVESHYCTLTYCLFDQLLHKDLHQKGQLPFIIILSRRFGGHRRFEVMQHFQSFLTCVAS